MDNQFNQRQIDNLLLEGAKAMAEDECVWFESFRNEEDEPSDEDHDRYHEQYQATNIRLVGITQQLKDLGYLIYDQTITGLSKGQVEHYEIDDRAHNEFGTFVYTDSESGQLLIDTTESHVIRVIAFIKENFPGDYSIERPQAGIVPGLGNWNEAAITLVRLS